MARKICSGFFWVLLCAAVFSAEADPLGGLEESLRQIDEALTKDPPPTRELLQCMGALHRLASDAPRPLDDLLRRLEAQVEPIVMGGSEGDRAFELSHQARQTVELMGLKLEGSGGDHPSLGLVSRSSLPPANDGCANATLVGVGTLSSTTAGATNDGSASCGDSSTAPDVWYSYTAGADGLVTFDTFGSTTDTVISLHSACPDASGDHELSCSDDARGTLGSLLGRNMVTGETVLLRVSGSGGATGTFELDIDDEGGGIRGRVTNEPTGEPVEARIRVYTDTGGFYQYLESEPDGTYLVFGLSPGDWFLTAHGAGVLGEVWDDVRCQNCEVELVGTPIPVLQSLVEDIDFSLPETATISGTISEASTDDPIPSAVVRAYDQDGTSLGYDYTDANGGYRIRGLPGTSITLLAGHYYYQYELWSDIPCEPDCDVTTGTPISISTGSDLEGFDFALDRLGSISGMRTSNSETKPSVYGKVEAYDMSGSLVRKTDLSYGSYKIDRLPAGDYYVQTSTVVQVDEVYDDLPCLPTCPTLSGEPVSVQLNAETPNIDFALDILGVLKGTIHTSDGGDFYHANVELYNEDLEEVGWDPLWGSTTWTIPYVLPGTYYIFVSLEYYENEVYGDVGCQPSCSFRDGTPVTVTLNSTIENLDFVVDRCTADSHLEITGRSFIDARSREACRTIHAGTDVTVEAGGHLTLTAGRSISFGDGFKVKEGGRLTVVVDP